MPRAMYCVSTSRCGLRPVLGGLNGVTFGSGVVPSANVISPSPPDTFRMFNSKSWTSSKIAEWFRTLMSPGLFGANVPFSGNVRRGPLAKIQTTPSVSPKGWQAKHELQPSLDRRAPTVPSGPNCGRFTPVELLNTAFPRSTVASCVPAAGRSAERTVAITWSVVRLMTETSREDTFSCNGSSETASSRSTRGPACEAKSITLMPDFATT